jgi:putative ABC transport system permease protein
MANDPENGLRSWGAVIAYTYVKFSNRSEAAAVQSALPGFVKRHAHDPYPATIDVADFLKLRLTPVTDIHFADAKNSLAMKPGADVRLVFALGLIGVLTLLLAVANYINLATARSSLRAKEVALRKVMGATRLAIGLQMLAESIMFAIVATLIGVALAELALPVVNALGGTELHLTYWGPQSSLPYLAGVAIAVGAAAGVYPALLLSRFEPAPVLAASRSPGGGKLEARIRVVLISAQFVVAIVITICTLVIGAQARFIHTQDRGFRRDGLIVLDNVAAVLLAQRQTQLLDSFRRTPGVVSATATLRVPGLADGEGLTAVHRPGAKGPPVAIGDDIIADNFLKTMGTRLAAGRMFDQAHGLDDIKGPFGEGADNAAARGLNVVINQTAARALGFSSPSQAIGKQIFVGAGPGKTSTIIGVIQDIQLGSPLHPVTGVIYWYDSKGDGGAVGIVRYAGVDSAVMIARLRSLWSREAASVPFIGETSEDLLSGFYVPDAQRARIFSIGSTLALAIACVGLYGLASFNTARRTKEIGIRKTLGASTGDILKLLIGQFLAPVLVANLIAWPLAYVAMRSWLSGFDQRIALSPLYFVVATLLALLIATLTVAGQAWRVARSEPAKALRHE